MQNYSFFEIMAKISDYIISKQTRIIEKRDIFEKKHENVCTGKVK